MVKGSQQTEPLSWFQRGALQGSAAAVLLGFCPTLLAAFWPSCLSLDVPLIGCHTHYCFGPNASAGDNGGPCGSVPAAVVNTDSHCAGCQLFLPSRQLSPSQRHADGLLPSVVLFTFHLELQAGFRHTQTASLYNFQTQTQNKLCEPVLGITLCVRPSG